ncbi:transcriptional regulator [Pseudomonas ficuserectae]|uniref:transcriptional regulator n=1 Tax=Pseudomonas ficuserectae TaxID=53410 RepID=UPI003F9FC629
MADLFRLDPVYAAELLSEVRRNGDPAELTIFLRQMAEAFGQDVEWKLVDAEAKFSSK